MTKKKPSHRTIYILRHAKSKRPRADVIDYERKLTKRGIKDARDFASELLRHETWLDQVIASSAPRGRDTATIVIDALQVPPERVHFDRNLYGATVKRWLGHLRRLEDKKVWHVLLVGHNPEIEMLVRRLTGIQSVQTPPGGAVALSYRGSWKDLATHRRAASEFRWSYYPRRYLSIRPEIMQATDNILSSARQHLPEDIDENQCRRLLGQAIQDAVVSILGKKNHIDENFASAKAKTGSGGSATTAGNAQTNPISATATNSPGKSIE